MTQPAMKPATPLPWIVGEYDDSLGYDCMTGGMRAGPVVLDASDYGQKRCVLISDETLAALRADAEYIAAACNAYPQLVAALKACADGLQQECNAAGPDDVRANPILRSHQKDADRAYALLRSLGDAQ